MERVVNIVIISILEYYIYNIIFSQIIYNKIFSSYLSIAKYESNLAITIPNSTLFNYNIYSIN